MHSASNFHGNPVMKRTLRSYLRWVYIYVLHYTGLLALAKRWVRSHGAVVLTFHRVLSEQAAAHTCSPAGLVVRERTFESLLRFVADRYCIFDLGAGTPTASADRVQVAITFDDGWEDNASTAFPVASRLEVPFTIFICPKLMGMPTPFWPEQIIALFRSADSAGGINRIVKALTSCQYPEWAKAVASANGDGCDVLIERLKSVSAEERRRLLQALLSGRALSEDSANSTVDRTMSWAQVTELQKAGVTFGSHTQSHEILTHVSRRKAEQEVSDSKADIEQRVGTCSLLSYPNGDVSRDVRDIVERCRYKQAFINSPGVWRKEDDRFLVPRINLSEGTVTGPNGCFSPLAFEHRVFWNAFIHRTHRAAEPVHFGKTSTVSPVEKFNTL